jgi:hypothetical protein
MPEHSDDEVKAEIMNRLMRRGCWGGRYLPLDSFRKDGKRVRRLIKELVKEGYILLHKGGKTISLNPALNREIIEYIERIIRK